MRTRAFDPGPESMSPRLGVQCGSAPHGGSAEPVSSMLVRTLKDTCDTRTSDRLSCAALCKAPGRRSRQDGRWAGVSHSGRKKPRPPRGTERSLKGSWKRRNGGRRRKLGNRQCGLWWAGGRERNV